MKGKGGGRRRIIPDQPIWNMDTLPSYTLALADDDVIFVVIGLMGSGNMSKSVIISTYALLVFVSLRILLPTLSSPSHFNYNVFFP
jgi:hypothetical protein